MPSQIAWLDATPEEQRAARELIAMFSDKESRDELGIGPIRDAFSDLLFPGTSVLQTRARYYLFVPWCFLTRDTVRLSGSAYRDKGRGNERTLIKTLRETDASDMTGLIGARAGVNVLNLPSDIYWNGMLRYGIREYRGSIGSLNVLGGSPDEATELTERRIGEWSRTVPPAPAGFPETLDDGFALSADEADWLRDRIVSSTEGTLLAYLLERGAEIDSDCFAPWLAAPASRFEELHHARMFSSVIEGAALLYNLIIAERHHARGLASDDEDRVGDYQERLLDWQENLEASWRDALDAWDLDRTWELTRRTNPNIQPRSAEFVSRWVNGLKSTRDLVDDSALRGLVEEREKRKGAQSRLKNEKMLAAWSGASGTGLMTYRWGSVRTIVNDIVRGLHRAGA